MDEPIARPGLGAERIQALAQLMERDIGLGDLGPGAWLKQIDLERRYGATRMEVRQALDRLVAKGLVEHLARRGYRVAEFDAERQAQIMEVRAVLEAAAAELVIDRHDEASLAAMEREAERYRAALMDGTGEEPEEANLAFHRLMLAPCPNRALVELLFDLRGRVAVSRRRNGLAVLHRSIDQHFQIVRLLRARDLKALQQLMREHNLSPNAPGRA